MYVYIYKYICTTIFTQLRSVKNDLSTVMKKIGCYIPPLSMHLFIPRSETVPDARLLISHYQLCACVAKNLIPLFNRNAGGTARGSPHLQQNNGSICRCLASTKEKC